MTCCYYNGCYLSACTITFFDLTYHLSSNGHTFHCQRFVSPTLFSLHMLRLIIRPRDHLHFPTRSGILSFGSKALGFSATTMSLEWTEFKNSVSSVKEAPILVILSEEPIPEWCEQVCGNRMHTMLSVDAAT